MKINDKLKGEKYSRKGFLERIVGGIILLIGGFLAFPLVSSLVEPVVSRREEQWRDVGAVADFKKGETRKVVFRDATYYDWGGKISESAAHVRRGTDGEWKAFSVNCSHLGCPVRWESEPQMFFCPCHGGAFYKDGSRAAGPPNRGLYEYPIRVENGRVEVQTGAIPITNINVNL